MASTSKIVLEWFEEYGKLLTWSPISLTSQSNIPSNLDAIQHFPWQLIVWRSSFIIYVIFCPSKLFYISKTIRPLFKRFREHMCSLGAGKGCTRMYVHNDNPSHLHQACNGFSSGWIVNIGIHITVWCKLDYEALGPLGLKNRKNFLFVWASHVFDNGLIIFNVNIGICLFVYSNCICTL